MASALKPKLDRTHERRSRWFPTPTAQCPGQHIPGNPKFSSTTNHPTVAVDSIRGTRRSSPPINKPLLPATRGLSSCLPTRVRCLPGRRVRHGVATCIGCVSPLPNRVPSGSRGRCGGLMAVNPQLRFTRLGQPGRGTSIPPDHGTPRRTSSTLTRCRVSLTRSGSRQESTRKPHVRRRHPASVRVDTGRARAADKATRDDHAGAAESSGARQVP